MDFNPRYSWKARGKQVYVEKSAKKEIDTKTDIKKLAVSPITQAPLDILNIIFEFLVPKDILSLASTCKGINASFKISSARKKIFFEISKGHPVSAWFNGNQITPVMCHLGVCYRDGFYVIGGDSPQNAVTANFGTILQEVNKYDFVKKTWEKVQIQGMQALTEHSGVLFQDLLYIFGGVRPGSVRSGDLLCFDMKKRIVRTVDAFGESPRGSCFACAIHDNHFYAIGGWNPDAKTKFMEVHEYNFETQYWTRVKTSPAPLFRRAHKSVHYGNYLYLFGGRLEDGYINEVLQFDLKTHEWKVIETIGTAPCPRSRSAVCLFKNKMCIHGGWNNTVLDDFFELDLDTFVWRQIPVNTGPILAQHSLVSWNDGLFIFGGNSGDRVSNALYGIFL